MKQLNDSLVALRMVGNNYKFLGHIGVDDSQWREMTLRRGAKGGAGSIVIELVDDALDAVAIPLRGQIT